jgi:hypothetical protein
MTLRDGDPEQGDGDPDREQQRLKAAARDVDLFPRGGDGTVDGAHQRL